MRNHPFAVEAFFEYSVVLTFAVPHEKLQHLIPTCLELDVFQNKKAFLAVALVQTKNLRPKGFPVFLGNDFFLIGYRIFVKYINEKGKRLRGLYILRSETNQKTMELLGNIFTNYKYSTIDVSYRKKEGERYFKSLKSGFDLVIREGRNNEIPLPAGSPFFDWKEARKFAGPLPFTFSFNESTQKVLIVEGVRENWTPAPIEVLHCHFPFLEELNLQDATLANAFIIEDIPYHWKKGRTEQWIKK